MTKSELIKHLEQFDDNATIEVSISSEIDSEQNDETWEFYHDHDKMWLEIEAVDDHTTFDVELDTSNEHCLLHCVKIVMR